MERARITRMARLMGAWTPAVLLVLIMAPQGWSKFNDTSGWSAAFRHWGYPDWFRVAVGVVEVSAAVLLILGRTAAFGAILVIVVMLGAWATHIILDGGRHMTSEIVPLTLAVIVLVVRRSQVRELARRYRPAAR